MLSPVMSSAGLTPSDSGASCVARSLCGSTVPPGPATDQTGTLGKSRVIDCKDSQILNPGVGPSAITAFVFASFSKLRSCPDSNIQFTGKGIPRDMAPRIDQ